MIDLFFFLIVFLFLGISWLVGAYLLDSVTTPILPIVNGTEGTTMINQVKTSYQTFDFIFAFIFIVLNLVPIYLSVMVKNHPIFFVINIILFIIYMILTPVISNAMRTIWLQPQFVEYSAGGSGYVTFSIMTRIFQYLPLMSFGLAFIVSVAMFGKGE